MGNEAANVKYSLLYSSFSQKVSSRGRIILLKISADIIRGHLDTSTILLPMGLLSIGNISMIF